MIHGPCGYQNLNSPCMNEDKSKCTKNFPKQYNDGTIIFNIGSYQVYKRRNGAKKIIFPSQKLQTIVLLCHRYNSYLSFKLRDHINIEVYNTIKSIKYLFKYFYKGLDRAIICLSNSGNIIEDHADISVRNTATESDGRADGTTHTMNYDEIEQLYVSTRYICPPEAMYRIYQFKFDDQSHR